jgi:hypothetical protein
VSAGRAQHGALSHGGHLPRGHRRRGAARTARSGATPTRIRGRSHRELDLELTKISFGAFYQYGWAILTILLVMQYLLGKKKQVFGKNLQVLPVSYKFLLICRLEIFL